MLKSQHFTTCPPDNPVTFAAKTSGFASKLPHKGLEVAKDGNEREKERDKDRDKERDKERDKDREPPMIGSKFVLPPGRIGWLQA